MLIPLDALLRRLTPTRSGGHSGGCRARPGRATSRGSTHGAGRHPARRQVHRWRSLRTRTRTSGSTRTTGSGGTTAELREEARRGLDVGLGGRPEDAEPDDPVHDPEVLSAHVDRALALVIGEGPSTGDMLRIATAAPTACSVRETESPTAVEVARCSADLGEDDLCHCDVGRVVVHEFSVGESLDGDAAASDLDIDSDLEAKRGVADARDCLARSFGRLEP